jgi:hypothetical protein
MDRRYPPLDPRSYQPARLTPAQVESLSEDRRNALFEVLGTRVEIANLLKERQPGAIQSTATAPTEARAKHYFDSASDDTLRAVDRHLKAVEDRLRDPGGGYRYRGFTPDETKRHEANIAKGERGYAALHNSRFPHSVGVNYPVYSGDPKPYRLETQIHEWLHDGGFSPDDEKYGWRAVDHAKTPGGTAWAVNQNPDNTAMFAVRRWPFGGAGAR